MLNTPTVYILLCGYVHQEPKLYGIYDNLDSLREAVVEIATPIREEMQRVLPYRECLLKANRDWGVTGVELERMATYPECLSEKENLCGCHLNAEKREKCHHYKSRSQYEEELEEALENLQYPAQNVYVVKTSLNNLPERGAFFDTFKNHHINGRWYQLFSPYTYPSVSELYNGEEIFNLYEGPLSDMEPEIRKRMEEEKCFIRKWQKI